MAASVEVNGVTKGIGKRSEAWRSQAMVGDLPQDFLRIMITPQQAQCAQDAHTARMLDFQQNAHFTHPTPAHPAAHYAHTLPGGTTMVGRLNITIVEARLTKNYGMTRMDPYCRLRIGHAVFETPTAYNGAKNPRWQKSVTCFLPQNVDTVHLEIFDERAFSMDDRIAWCDLTLPSTMIDGTGQGTLDDWYPLSGRQGDEKEGSINMVVSFVKGAQPGVMSWNPGLQPMVMMPMEQPQIPSTVPTTLPPPTGPGAAPAPGPPPPVKEDVDQILEMFPGVEEEVVKSVLEANGGDKEAAINGLLSMQ